jgi:hypothetical protein
MKTARLAVFRAPGVPFGFAERPLPACGEGEALVSESFPLTQLPEAFALARTQRWPRVAVRP